MRQKICLPSISILMLPFIIIVLSSCEQGSTAETTPTQISEIAPTFSNTEIQASIETETLPTDTALVTQPVLSTSNPYLESIGGIELRSNSFGNGLSLLEDIKTHWIRYNGLLWGEVEPVEGQRNWETIANFESHLQTASARGYEVILIIRYAPEWAHIFPEYQCGPILPEKLDAFANFTHDAVARYSVPPYNVRYWELGNEPDVDHKLVSPNKPYGCWGDDQDMYYGGGYYAEMLKAVYPKIKAADPEAQVLVGGLLLGCDPLNPPESLSRPGETADCSPSNFLEGILKNGGGDFFDGISFHAYDYYYETFAKYGNHNWHSSWETNGPTIAAKSNFLRNLLDAYGHPDKFLMNTETALICGRDGSEPICQTEEFEQSKANYAAQSYAMALAEGLRANVWYSLTGWRGSGLVNSDMQPTSAFNSYTFSLNMLENPAYLAPITDYPGIIGYQFLKDGENLWVVWGTQDDLISINLPTLPQTIFDIYGNSLPVSQTIDVGKNVIYLTFAP